MGSFSQGHGPSSSADKSTMSHHYGHRMDKFRRGRFSNSVKDLVTVKGTWNATAPLKLAMSESCARTAYNRNASIRSRRGIWKNVHSCTVRGDPDLKLPKSNQHPMEKCWWAIQQKQSVKIYSQYKVVTKYNAAQSPAYDWQEGEHGVWFHVYAGCTISRQNRLM